MIALRCCLTVLVLAGCAGPPARHPQPAPPPPSRITPGNISKVAAMLPPGHEVAAVSGVSAPPAVWGMPAGGTADPPRCAVLDDPVGGGSSRGLSGSGPDGISYAVVTTAPGVALDDALIPDCAQWSLTQGRTTARVRLVDAPHIDGAATLGMVCDIRTRVEGNTEIASRADTFAAYLGDYYVFTALVADPGAPPSGFAAELLIKTVAALRS